MARKTISGGRAALGAAALLMAAGQSSAQLTSITITDGSAQLVVNGVSGERTTTGGGQANLTTGTGVSPVDHVFQNWFWYRCTGDTREYALSNVVGPGSGDGLNRARLVYVEPSNDGATPNALWVELSYTISDLSTGTDRPERSLVTIAFKIENLTNAPLNVQFYSYNDMDLNGSAGGDSCRVSGASNHIQQISDPGATQFRTTRAVYACGGSNMINYQVAAYPTIVNDLADVGVDNLTDTAPVFGPGDYTGGQQWGTTLAAAGSTQSSLVGSVTIEIETNVCRADFDNNGDVNSTDISAFLTGWIDALNGGCP